MVLVIKMMIPQSGESGMESEISYAIYLVLDWAK